MAKLTTIYWRNIPAQLIYRKGRKKLKRSLPDRFAIAIDRAAMRAGRGSSEDYLNDWRREHRECGEENEGVLDREFERLTKAYPEEVLNALIKNGGL